MLKTQIKISIYNYTSCIKSIAPFLGLESHQKQFIMYFLTVILLLTIFINLTEDLGNGLGRPICFYLMVWCVWNIEVICRDINILKKNVCTLFRTKNELHSYHNDIVLGHYTPIMIWRMSCSSACVLITGIYFLGTYWFIMLLCHVLIKESRSKDPPIPEVQT
jgi:hypothetical protein